MADETLPTYGDFDPWNGHPDALWAHGIFGGLTIPEAIQKYRERPDVYQEAFMFMGDKAFAYYFPVLEDFVYSCPDLTCEKEDWEDPCAWILAHGIKAHFDGSGHQAVQHLAERIIELARFVQNNLHRFEPDSLDVYGVHGPHSVSDAWAELVETVQSHQNPPSISGDDK